ncbi:MAG: siderophore-interacting protein [Gammaproteobacteria bacterium]|nr:siderophore-interacting protein [Gammaproteobacteria bacterium]
MSRPLPRELEVLATADITPHMRRITLGGSGMATFPQEDQGGAYIKLVFPQQGGAKPLLRTYTVRNQREGEIDVDFVLHDAPGPASRWATQAGVGDRILVGGPGPRKLINSDGDWCLFVGDMTALPAISVNLELLPADTRGYAVLEVLHEEDIQPLRAPQNLQLVWVVNPDPDPEGRVLAERIAALPWLEGSPAVWAASEFNSMRELRRCFREVRPVEKKLRYISSYWKMGISEDQHKIDKKRDAELNAD